jgi:hypothetical protein
VVLDTADGVRQWTVRLVVTPQAGYVASVEPTAP